MWIAIGIAGGLLFLLLFPFLLAFPIACCETRYVWPYEPLDEAKPPAVPFSPGPSDAQNPYQSPPPLPGEAAPPMTSEARFANQAAQALGMRYVGVLRHATSKVIQARYDFWLSPGREF